METFITDLHIQLGNIKFFLQVWGLFIFKMTLTFEMILPKQITSPGWMHETSARTWCTGKTQRDRIEREVGGGIGMGNTCKSMANSCQCMTKNHYNIVK